MKLVPDLILFTKNNDLLKVKQAIKDGFDVNCRDYAGRTALFFSISLGNTEITSFLLKNGASILKNNSNVSPFNLACKNDDIEMVEELIFNSDVRVGEEDLFWVNKGTPVEKMLKYILDKKMYTFNKKHG